jgi:hypothetical protein
MEGLTGIKFKRSLLATFAMLSIPGKYTVKVFTNVSEKNLFTDEKGQQRYIIGLRAIAPDQVPQLKQVFAEGVEEVDIEETNGLFLTAAIWKKDENDQPALPMKGEEVEVNFGPVLNRDGEEVLRITNIHVLPAKKAEAFSLASLNTQVAAEAGAGAIAG